MEQQLQTQQVSIQDLKQGEWVIVVANGFYFSPVYIFVLLIRAYNQIFYSELPAWLKQFTHAARIKEGEVIEMVGKGRTVTPFAVWLTRANRKVAVFKATEPFRETTGGKYGYFDLPFKVWQKIRLWIYQKAGLKIGGTWNGTDHVPVAVAGLICSEEVLEAIGEEDAHLYAPIDLFMHPKLLYLGTLSTYKK